MAACRSFDVRRCRPALTANSQIYGEMRWLTDVKNRKSKERKNGSIKITQASATRCAASIRPGGHFGHPFVGRGLLTNSPFTTGSLALSLALLRPKGGRWFSILFQRDYGVKMPIFPLEPNSF
jgi:hypothetical protein